METEQISSFQTISAEKRSSRLAFEQLMNETVDKILSSLGTVCKQGIYDYLEKKFELKKDDLADNIVQFSEALERIFGDAAALVEIQIMKELCRKVPQFRYAPEGQLTFPDYVNALSRFVSGCGSVCSVIPL